MQSGVILSTAEKQKHGVSFYILAGVSFIPLVGIFAGLACIIGAVRGQKSNSKLIGGLGFAGIMVSVVLFGNLAYHMFTNFDSKQFEPQSIKNLSLLVNHIEKYKSKNGQYPLTLEALRENLAHDEFITSFDVSLPIQTSGEKLDFHYELINRGQNYLLFGIGQDTLAFTNDDIFPDVESKNEKHGWLKSK